MQRLQNTTKPSILTCKDIARQLIQDYPGKHFSVILGGGYGNFLPAEDGGYRADGRNLVDEWINATQNNSVQTRTFVNDATAFKLVSPSLTQKLLGLFDIDHLPYEVARPSSVPSLREMTHKAIDILSKNDKGYFLLVEGGRIDHALHSTLFKVAAEEVIAFDDAIQLAIAQTNKHDTLIVATADHSHVLNIMGYAPRNVSVLGHFIEPDVRDSLPVPVLVFADGNSSNFENNSISRRNLSLFDTDSVQFQQESFIPRLYESHGGEDVGVYARGPGANLFTGVLNNHDIAHSLAYALCIGPSKNVCDLKKLLVQKSQTLQHDNTNLLVAILVLLIICTLLMIILLTLIYTWKLSAVANNAAYKCKNKSGHSNMMMSDAHF